MTIFWFIMAIVYGLVSLASVGVAGLGFYYGCKDHRGFKPYLVYIVLSILNAASAVYGSMGAWGMR